MSPSSSQPFTAARKRSTLLTLRRSIRAQNAAWHGRIRKALEKADFQMFCDKNSYKPVEYYARKRYIKKIRRELFGGTK